MTTREDAGGSWSDLAVSLRGEAKASVRVPKTCARAHSGIHALPESV